MTLNAALAASTQQLMKIAAWTSFFGAVANGLATKTAYSRNQTLYSIEILFP